MNDLPLIPVASNLWGWQLAAILSVVGWTLGAWVSFTIARKYGLPLISRFISVKKLHAFEKKIPRNHIFLSIIILRIAVPVDLLSYALGLFSSIKTRDYIIATAIGVTPFAVIFALIGQIPFIYQVIGVITAVVIFLIGVIIAYTYKEHEKRKKAKLNSMPK